MTYTRPSNGRSLDCTSGSNGVAAKSGRSARSIGMSTTVNVEMFCGLPVLEYLEVFLLQVTDEIPLLVGDDRVDLDVLDLRP